MPSQPLASGRSATPDEPSTVRTAKHLIYLGVAVHILGLVGLFLWHDTIREGIEREHPSWGATRISAEVLTHQAGAAVFVVLLIVLWLWLVDKVEEARPWAPAAVTVLAAVGAIGALQMAMDAAFPDAAKVGVGIASGIGLGSAALLWAPTSRAFFRRTTALAPSGPTPPTS